MRKKMIRVLLGLLASFVGVSVLAFVFAPGIADPLLNPVRHKAPYKIPTSIQKAYHAIPFIADLHADSLLWKRDLLLRNTHRGHVDIPRLLDANVALQVFSIVSQSPVGQNEVRTDGNKLDRITWIAILQGWPMRTWGSRLQRALYQANKLHGFAARSQGRLTIIKHRKDLQAYLQKRGKAPKLTAGLLAVEGAQVLEGKIAHVDTLFQAGFRMMAATHFFDNRLGGSAHGIAKGGLTPFGKQVLRRMEELHMIVDLAHVSEKIIDDTLAIAKRPVVVSHTGVRGTCPNQRNLHDRHIKAIAKNGGIIGIGLWNKAVCGTDAHATAKAMRYVANLVGVKHVALGSDFDGTIKSPFDVTGLPLLLQAMQKAGFQPQEIAQILGGNFLRILQQTLPPQ